MDEREPITPGGIRLAPACLSWRFARSGGPGGQHVNKASTAAMLRVAIADLGGLDDAARERLLAMAGAALVGGGATALWHLRRARAPRPQPAESNRDVNLDVGELVTVEAWRDDGSARVQYRGAAWTARLASAGTQATGSHRIVGVHGNELRLAPAQPD